MGLILRKREKQALVDLIKPLATPQSTSGARHANDIWLITNKTSRFVTAIDETITTNIYSDGTASITGDKDPVTMPPCLSQK